MMVQCFRSIKIKGFRAQGLGFRVEGSKSMKNTTIGDAHGSFPK